MITERLKKLLLTISAAFLITGCTHYLEEETPSGSVPPPSPAAASEQRGAVKAAPAAIAKEASPTSNPSKMTAQSREEALQGTFNRFSKVYLAKNSPRIAVFLNRALSDDVREWRTNQRTVIAAEGVKSETSDRKSTSTEVDGGVKTEVTTEPGTDRTETKGAVAGFVERPAPTGARAPVANETWMWAFEDGFLQPFLQAKGKMVDRATIMRLQAAKAAQGTALQPVAVKHVEIDALKDYADVFVEILIVRSPSALYGYEFKASAKEVNTGLLLANVTSLRWRPEERVSRAVIATSDGYKVVQGIELPAVDEVASDLAGDLMNALASQWGE